MKNTLPQSLLTLCVLLGLTVASSQPAKAQFVAVVHDPVNLLTLVKQLGSEVKNGATLSEQLSTATKIFTLSTQMYNVALQETSFIKNKQVMLAVGFAAQNAQIPGHKSWDDAMTAGGGIAIAGGAWQQMMAPGTSMASRIQMADSFATATLNSIGSCNAAARGNDAAIGRLESMAIDLNPAANTRANQANVSNLSAAQQLRVQECQHNLQLQQAKLELLKVQDQRTRDQQQVDRQTQTVAIAGSLSSNSTSSAIKNIVDR